MSQSIEFLALRGIHHEGTVRGWQCQDDELSPLFLSVVRGTVELLRYLHTATQLLHSSIATLVSLASIPGYPSLVANLRNASPDATLGPVRPEVAYPGPSGATPVGIFRGSGPPVMGTLDMRRPGLSSTIKRDPLDTPN